MCVVADVFVEVVGDDVGLVDVVVGGYVIGVVVVVVVVVGDVAVVVVAVVVFDVGFDNVVLCCCR